MRKLTLKEINWLTQSYIISVKAGTETKTQILFFQHWNKMWWTTRPKIFLLFIFFYWRNAHIGGTEGDILGLRFQNGNKDENEYHKQFYRQTVALPHCRWGQLLFEKTCC